MRFAVDFAVAVIMVSPLAGMLAGHLWARVNHKVLCQPASEVR
jgi:hypothetical protein